MLFHFFVLGRVMDGGGGGGGGYGTV